MNTRYYNLIKFLPVIIFLSTGCKDVSVTPERNSADEPLFTLLTAEQTHVTFNNELKESLNANVLLYDSYYNGGGVAVGDVNGDGLQDIYFSGNMVSNKLYLNKGQMQFEDITSAAGVSARSGPWKTGVTMADINADGKLDIYVCHSGKLRGEKRKNELFINKGTVNGTPTFMEAADEFGLADSSFSTQGIFFDYDKDADLDMLLVNHNINRLSLLDDASTLALLKKDDRLNGNRLFRNEKGYFKEITNNSRLAATALNYGNAAAVADINGDGWQDMYYCNDFASPDYLYHNQRNGVFEDKLQEELGHVSYFSMGADIADINNDGLVDIFTLDMLPADNRRQKLLFAPDNYELNDFNLRMGFHHQYMRNMLHLNNGNNSFSEIGQLSGISNTDWSWAALFADYDNDGWKDLFISNGFARDYTNMDFLKFMGDKLNTADAKVYREDLLNLVKQMPSSDVTNYIFKNNGDLTFSDKQADWGMRLPSNSNGAAYADLDNDGDLDLVINNINKAAFIYRNEASRQAGNHWLQVKLEGLAGNTQGIGAKVTIYSKSNQQYQEQMPVRGYQSSVSPIIHFGLADENSVDSLTVIWNSGRKQTIKSLKADQLYTLSENEATERFVIQEPPRGYFEKITSPINYNQPVTAINDFKRQPQLLHPLSMSGPCMAKADINADGSEDVFMGGGNGNPGIIYIQKNKAFLARSQPDLMKDRMSEDADAVFFDANADGFTDLYIATGGYHHYQPGDALLQDRLYLGDGKGNLRKTSNALPAMLNSKSCVRVTDIDGDGDPDLFVGGRVIPGRYPEVSNSYLLINDGKGKFTDKIKSLAPELEKSGMITDAAWTDLNGDGKQDLIVVGEWMPISVYININGQLKKKTTDYFDKEYSGWWNKLLLADLNNDGKKDLVAGNEGLNTQCKVSDKEPAEMFYKDFDDNGSVDPVFCFYMQGKSYPYVSRDELLDQMSIMRNRFPDYKTYSTAELHDIFTREELQGSSQLTANHLKTSCFILQSNGKFQLKPLPAAVQFAPVFTIDTLDFNNDGIIDLLFCGNRNKARLRFGKSDANYGILLQGMPNGRYKYVSQQQSGFKLRGDVRSTLRLNNEILFGINQGSVQAYKLRE